MKLIDIIAILFILLGGFLGFKKGAIRGIIQFIGLVAIAIVAYQFKGFLATLFIKNLPFFNYAGNLEGLLAVNIMLYDAFAFMIIFIILYCILNILLTISGLIDILVKATIILEIPSKIVGIIIGLIESIIFVFVAGVFLLEFPQTQKFIMESTIIKPIVERTPIVNVVFKDVIASSENIYNEVVKSQGLEDKKSANVDILEHIVSYGVIDATVIQEVMDNGKLPLDNVMIKGNNK